MYCKFRIYPQIYKITYFSFNKANQIFKYNFIEQKECFCLFLTVDIWHNVYQIMKQNFIN